MAAFWLLHCHARVRRERRYINETKRTFDIVDLYAAHSGCGGVLSPRCRGKGRRTPLDCLLLPSLRFRCRGLLLCLRLVLGLRPMKMSLSCRCRCRHRRRCRCRCHCRLLGVNRGVLVLDSLQGSGGRQQVRDRLPVRDRVGGEVTRSVATLGKNCKE